MDSGITDEDRRWLARCVELAAAAAHDGDGPFGSVLVDGDGALSAEGRNRECSDGDPTAHPELALAQWAARNLSAAERAAATMYTSGEHCAMCAAAHAWVGLGRIVYASSSEQLTRWRAALGLPPSPVRPLAIREVAPHVVVEGPSAELAPSVQALHHRRHVLDEGRP